MLKARWRLESLSGEVFQEDPRKGPIEGKRASQEVVSRGFSEWLERWGEAEGY